MSTTLTISDELAAAVEGMRKEAGMASIDAVAEILLADAIALDATSDLALSTEALRALIVEAEASGPVEPWDAKAVREEFCASSQRVRRRRYEIFIPDAILAGRRTQHGRHR